MEIISMRTITTLYNVLILLLMEYGHGEMQKKAAKTAIMS